MQKQKILKNRLQQCYDVSSFKYSQWNKAMECDLKLIQKSVIKYNVALGEVVRVARQVAPEDKALPQQCSRHLQALVVDDGGVRYDQRYHHLHQGTLPALRKKDQLGRSRQHCRGNLGRPGWRVIPFNTSSPLLTFLQQPTHHFSKLIYLQSSRLFQAKYVVGALPSSCLWIYNLDGSEIIFPVGAIWGNWPRNRPSSVQAGAAS